MEKTALKQQHADIKAEHGQITAEAGKYSISVTDYEAAYKKADSALTKYTASTPEYITVESDYSDISAYYSKRQTILDTIAAKAKEASDAAKKAADDAAAKAEEAAESASEAAQKAIEAKTAADNAAKAAKNAQTDADEANSMLSDIANDNKLTAQEKQQTKKEWDVIVSEKPKNDASADKFGVSKTAYGSAYTALSTYITPLLSNLSSTSNITGTEFRAKFKAYYDARTDLLNAISAKAKELADNAQEAADAAAENASQAIEDAAKAKNAADKAQADVDAEKERMDEWAADGKFSPSEKKQLKEELARIDGDKTQVTDGYTKYGLGTPTAYNTAYTNYRTAINGVVSSSSETVAIPSDFATKRTAYYTQKSTALTAISDAAKAYADKVVAGIEVGGRNLLENSLDGAGWYKASISNGVFYQRAEAHEAFIQSLSNLDIKGGVYYTLSFDYYTKNNGEGVDLFLISSNGTKVMASKSKIGSPTSWTHYVWTFKTSTSHGDRSDCYVRFDNNGTNSGFSELWVRYPKLEKGTVATSWTPAIEDVNGMIEDAQKAADDAAEAAKNAQADATNANKELANIKSDNLISPIEKTALKQQQADIRSEYGEITANASRYAVSTTAYKSAYDLANAALTKYTASSPEYITVGSDYANISAYYDARKTILDAIAAAAKKAVDDATNKANQAVEDAARAGHYYLDLDNDGGPVSCDASGNVTGGFPSSKATVYYGTEPDTGWAFTGAFSGCSGSVNSSTGQITVTGVSADTGTVTVTAKKSGKTDLSAVFSVYKVKAGADGADGTNGVGIKSITNKYAVSASNTTAPTSWSDTVPTMTTTNRYLWNYEIVTYTNSTTSETKKRVIGAYGNTGNTGATGATGPKGDAAVFYTIEPSANVVKKSWDNKLTPTSVTCTKYKQTGSNARATTTEKTLKYQRVGTDSSVQTAASGSSVTVSPTSTTTSIKFWLYDGSNIIMMQEVPVVGDAVDVYTKVHAEITAAEGEIGLLSTKVTTVTDSVTGLEKEVETNTAEIKSAKGQISSTASQVSSLGTRVSTVEQTASSLKTTVQGIQGDVSTLEQTTSKISLKVDSIWPDNIFPDGSFENGGLANRNLSNCTVSIDTSSHIHGSKSLKIQCVTGNSWVYVGRAQIPVVSGKVYTIVMWIRATSTFTESGGATGAYFSKNDQLELAGFTAFQPQFTSSWTRKAYKVTAPSGSNYLVLRLGTAGQTTSRTLYFDSIMVFEGDLTGSLPSGFVEGKHDGELATGIDVINKKITVTSDQFVIQNNDGEVTASVDADGVLKIGSGEFSGYMKTVPQVDPNNNSVTVTRDVLKKGGFFCFPTRDGSSRGTVTLPTSGDYLGTHLYIYSGSSVQTSGAKISYNGVETYTRLVVSTSCTYVELVAVPNSADAAKWHSYQTGESSTVPDIVWLLLVPGGATYTASGTALAISRA
mgnify:FL=1